METANQPQTPQEKVAQYVLLGVVQDALNLVHRYQEGTGFRGYVKERMQLLLPVGGLMALTSVACAAAMVLYLGGTRSLLVLFALLLVPVVLFGSFFVQAYVFGSWLEARALAKALQRRPRAPGPIRARLLKAKIDIGAMPPVPWVLAILFLGFPLAMLVSVAPLWAWTLVVLQIAAPFAFARLDQ